MLPIFACFPLCTMFGAITFLAIVILVFDLANRSSNEPPGETPADALSAPSRFEGQKVGPPPWWTLPLMMLALTVLMAILAWRFPE